MIQLAPEQRQELQQANGGIVRARDPDTGQEYVLVRAEVYQRLSSMLSDDDEFVEGLYPQVLELFGREGWNDPSMDIYNDLDPRKQA